MESKQPNSIIYKDNINSYLPHKKLKDIIVTIIQQPHKQDKKKINQELGQFHSISKTYFYKQRVILFVLFEYLLENHLKAHKKIVSQCQRILKFFETYLQSFSSNLKKKSVPQRFKKFFGQNFDTLNIFQEKIYSVFTLIRQKRIFQENNYVFDHQQIQIFLDIILNSWKKNIQISTSDKDQLKIEKNSFLKQVTQILLGKIEIEQQKPKQTFIKLQIYSQDQKNQKQFLYKKVKILMNNKIISEIIQTNQEKFIYFKTYPIVTCRAVKKKRISQLFKQNNRSELYQSENSSKNTSQNSQIIHDEQFFRISSKISNSFRKNSFNSGQIQAQVDQNHGTTFQNIVNIKKLDTFKLLPQSYLSTQKYPRSNSTSKVNSEIQGNLFTSIDLEMKLETERVKQQRDKSCENSRITKTTDSECKQSKFLGNLSSKIKLNIFDQTKSKRFEYLLQESHQKK